MRTMTCGHVDIHFDCVIDQSSASESVAEKSWLGLFEIAYLAYIRFEVFCGLFG